MAANVEKLQACSFCFSTLTPEDERSNYRTFLYCLKCGATYHQACYAASSSCVRCATRQQVENLSMEAVETDPLAQVQLRTIAIGVRPSAIAYSFDEFGLSKWGFVVPKSVGVLVKKTFQRTEETISTALIGQENEYAVAARRNAHVLAPILVVVFLLSCFCLTAVFCNLIVGR